MGIFFPLRFSHWILALFLVLTQAAADDSALAFERRTPVVMAVEKAGPAVVNIRTERIVKHSSRFFGFGDPLFDEFFRNLAPPRISKTESLGSGVIIDSQGYVLTNAHVVEKASKIFIALPDSNKEIEASLVGKADMIDIAVVKLQENGPYPFLKTTAADDLLVGETVIAIGNPLGLGHSVTTGIVSSPKRRIPRDDGSVAIFIQTDALINPGNSGGPLLNINGELIGINTAIIKQAQGLGFSIPISLAKRVTESLISHGEMPKVFSGIIAEQVGKELMAREGTGGVFAAHVEKDSPAAVSGIRYGDVIRELDGAIVSTPLEFYSLLQTYLPGNTLKLKVLRGFENLDFTVKLEKMPPSYGLRYLETLLGLRIGDAAGGEVKVTGVRKGSRASEVGIEGGDVLGEFAGKKILSSAQLSALAEVAMGHEPHRLLIIRGRKGVYIELP